MLTQHEGPGSLINSKIQGPATQVKMLGTLWASTAETWTLETVKEMFSVLWLPRSGTKDWHLIALFGIGEYMPYQCKHFVDAT